MSPSLRAAAQLIRDHLAQMGVSPDRTDDGIFLLKYGSTVVMLSLFEDEEHTFVRIAASVLTDVEPSLDLVTRLLRLNTEVLYGSFLLFEDNTLSFAHTLLADDLDFEPFEHALLYVARVADDHDEEIQAAAGGKRAEDVLSEQA